MVVVVVVAAGVHRKELGLIERQNVWRVVCNCVHFSNETLSLGTTCFDTDQ